MPRENLDFLKGILPAEDGISKSANEETHS
jgi:hypothetical protein